MQLYYTPSIHYNRPKNKTTHILFKIFLTEYENVDCRSQINTCMSNDIIEEKEN